MARARRSRNPPSAPRSAVMAQMRPGFLLGGEARYLRQYEGIGLEEFAGQALFVGPTAYFQLSRALAADRGLERSGLGRAGRIECGPRSRQFRAPPGAAGVRRQFLDARDRHVVIRDRVFTAVLKLRAAGYVSVRAIYSMLARDSGMNPIDLIVTVCAVLSPATCEEQHLVFSSTVRCGNVSWLRRPISRNGWANIRNGTRCGGAANIRTPTTRRMQASVRPQAEPDLRRATGYLLQSFRSLSAIENTASALISMSRTMHCLESR